MPKASSTSTPARSQKSSLFVFIHNNKRVLATRKTCYYEAIRHCRKLFSAIPENHHITFHTKDLPICSGWLTEINEEVWDEVIGNLTSVTVITEERENRPQEMLEVVAGNQDTHKDKPPGTITLTVTSPDNEKLAIRVRPDQKIQSIERAIENRWGSDNWREWRLTYASKTDYYWASFSTIEGLGIEDGDNLYLVKNQIGGKPVIYLFSPKTLEAEVKLSLISQWKLCAIYPVVPSKPRTVLSNEQVAWKVRTHANGDLTELTTGLNVTYLFWEAYTNSTVPPSPPASPLLEKPSRGLLEQFNPNEAVLNDENSVVMPVAIITPYLDKVLAALGLHTEARTSFITYWLPSILKHQHLAFRFLPQASYEEAAPLEISPSPDVTTRVFMIFQGVAEEELQGWTAASFRASEDVAHWRKIVGVDLERTSDTNLFRVLEWGGMEVHNHSST